MNKIALLILTLTIVPLMAVNIHFGLDQIDNVKPCETVKKNKSQSFENQVNLVKDAGLQTKTSKTKAADFTVTTLDGKKVSLKDLKGKIVFLNFWATWCPPCRAEMPSMQSLYEKANSKNFIMLAISDESQSTVKNFANSKGFTYQLATGKVDRSYSTGYVPTTFILDKEGYILGFDVGSKDWSTPELVQLFTSLSE